MKKYNELFALIFLLLLNINCSDTKPNNTTEKKANSSQNKKANSNDFKSIFNEIDFSGWEGNLDYFRIEDGIIKAGTLKEPIPRNEFLCTTKD